MNATQRGKYHTWAIRYTNLLSSWAIDASRAPYPTPLYPTIVQPCIIPFKSDLALVKLPNLALSQYPRRDARHT